MDEQYRRRREEEAAWMRERLPAWAEWAAWRWSKGDITQREIGAELGGLLTTQVSTAIRNYLFIQTDAPFWLYRGLYGYDSGGYWRIAVHGPARREFLGRHFNGRVPAFPGLVPRKRRPDTKERNRWIAEQRKAGRTLRSIGDEVGICPQRVRQICAAVARRELAGAQRSGATKELVL